MELLTIPEVMKMLRISRNAVYVLVHKGKLQAINISAGKRLVLRFRRDDLEAFLDANAFTTKKKHKPPKHRCMTKAERERAMRYFPEFF